MGHGSGHWLGTRRCRGTSLAIARTLNVQLWTAPRAFTLLALSLLTLGIATLAHALAIYGYGFQRLIEATGPVRATLILVALTAVHAAYTATPYGTPTERAFWWQC